MSAGSRCKRAVGVLFVFLAIPQVGRSQSDTAPSAPAQPRASKKLEANGTSHAGTLGPESRSYRDTWKYNVFTFNWNGKGRFHVDLKSDDPAAPRRLLTAVVLPDEQFTHIGEPKKLYRLDEGKSERSLGVRLKTRIEKAPKAEKAKPFYLYVFQEQTPEGSYPDFSVRLRKQSLWKPWQWPWGSVGAVFGKASCEFLSVVNIELEEYKETIRLGEQEGTVKIDPNKVLQILSQWCRQGQPRRQKDQLLSESEWPLILQGTKIRPPVEEEITDTLEVGRWYPRPNSPSDRSRIRNRQVGPKGQYYEVWELAGQANAGEISIRVAPRSASRFEPRVFLHDHKRNRIDSEEIRIKEQQWSFIADKEHELPFFAVVTTVSVEEEGQYNISAEWSEDPPLDRKQRVQRAHGLLGGLDYLLGSENPLKARWRGYSLDELLDQIAGVRREPSRFRFSFGGPTPSTTLPRGTAAGIAPGLPDWGDAGEGLIWRQENPKAPLSNPENLGELRDLVEELRDSVKSGVAPGTLPHKIRSSLLDLPPKR